MWKDTRCRGEGYSALSVNDEVYLPHRQNTIYNDRQTYRLTDRHLVFIVFGSRSIITR